MSKNKMYVSSTIDKTLNTIYQTIRSISNTPKSKKQVPTL